MLKFQLVIVSEYKKKINLLGETSNDRKHRVFAQLAVET